MPADMTLNILLASTLVLYVAVGAILIRQYLRTRDAGLVWLGVAVIVWPVVSRLLEGGERIFIDRLASHQSMGFYPFTLVASGQVTVGSLMTSFAAFRQFVGICFLLIAVLYLSRAKTTVVQPIA
jgi:hypothetical protein